MRTNLPISQREQSIPENAILSSTTDLKGTIHSASEDFVKISGFSREELMGQPHNLLRHPDVPAAVFADMWTTLKQGKSWTAIVKNRAKNGDHYWVRANASPVEEDGRITGYMSVRTPATREEVQAAEVLYRNVAQGKIILQGGVPRAASSLKWDIFRLKGSLNKALLVYAAMIMLIGALLLAAGFYWTQIKPIEQHALDREQIEARSVIESHIKGKAVSVTDLAATLAGYEEISAALAGQVEREVAVNKLTGLREHFARISDYQNIRAQAFTLDKTSFIKSWQPDSYGEAFSRPLLDKVITQRKVDGGMSLNMNGLGLGVTGYAPVYQQDQLVGVISATGGLASVGLELKALGWDWVMLIDEARFEGKLPVSLQKNKAFSPGFILAHNSWFDEKTVSFLQQHLTNLQAGATSRGQLVDDLVVIQLPAYNDVGTLIGQHILIRSAADIQQQIADATGQVIWTIAAVITLIILIVFILMFIVKQRAIKPLVQISRSMQHMRRSGRFNERVTLLDRGDEISDIANVYNDFVGSVQQALTNINDVMSSVSQGKLDVEISAPFQGDLAVMKSSINNTVGSVRAIMRELAKVMNGMKNGDFSTEVNADVSGEFSLMVDDMVQTMQTINGTINGIVAVMDKMKAGKFQRRVEVEAHGDLLRLKNGVNESMTALESAMKDITRIVVAQSNGDLTHKITETYHGELRILKEAVNSTADKLIDVVSQAVMAASIVSTAAEEVSQGSTSLSQRVQEQAAALEETSATMDEMNAAVQNTTENAQQTAKVAQDVQAKVSHGASVMQQTIVAMSAIQQSSHKIADIVSLIDGIAFQTNLLALNAAVEAARAGDHGRGFAVVAGEVRALAQKSAEAAKDIKNLINESVTRIDEGTRLATQSGEVLGEINQSIDGVADMVNQIAKASAEQSEGIGQVHNAIAQIDGVTQQNAALVEETSAASESLSEQANDLSRNMAFFNTGNHAKATPALNAPKKSVIASQTIAKPATKPVNNAKTNATAPRSGQDWSEF